MAPPETLRLSGIVRESIVDGNGLRFVVFCQGCPHHCPGCHNPQTHDFSGGKDVPLTRILAEIVKNSLLQGVTFSGGEPFCQAGAFAELARRIKALPGRLDVTVYSGYTYEELARKARTDPDTGEKVPTGEKQVGLYVLTGVQAEWRPVEILADDGDYCLVQSVLSDNPTATEQKKMLRAGDEVIVAAEDLFDGKVVR